MSDPAPGGAAPATCVVVTGGAGLVGANLAHRILADDPDARAVLIEPSPPPSVVTEFLAPFADRVFHRVADVRDSAALDRLDPPTAATHLVHAAALCHVPGWERADPRPFLTVNIGGTANVLEWARHQPRLRRVLHISSGGVYGDPTPQHLGEPQGEDGPFNPPETYAMSKLAGEQVATRYGELYGIDVRVVRLSAVFGPLERVTVGRTLMSLPYAVARALGRNEPLRLSARSLDAVGDWLSATDVAVAARRVLFDQSLPDRVLNIAAGELTSVRTLLAAVAASAPQFRHEVVDTGADPDLDMDPALRRARWNAYSIERVRRSTGWSPRPLVDQLDAYLRWADADPSRRCP